MNLSIQHLKKLYKSGVLKPRDIIADVLSRCDALNDKSTDEYNPIWIYRLSERELEPYLIHLENSEPDDLPLYGIPFAIKDNIDLAGINTTAACPEFSYTANKNAYVVACLIKAGAIPIGKTNMDQFATGLVGVRSPEPWGPCKNALNPEIISGGSSSGSAVAVAEGLVSFSLGTDTAGSGRVPASLNNIVGLKPTRGVLSCSGVVPACKSLDCVSIFATNIDDANTVFDVVSVFDQDDAYARKNVYANGKRYGLHSEKTLRLGVPKPHQLAFFENKEAERLFYEALECFKHCDTKIVEIDLDPFISAAKLLYEGPWVAERYLATQELFESNQEAMLPVIQTIIGGGKNGSAADAFSSQYQLNTFKQRALQELAKVDAIITPTNGTYYSINDVLENPIQLNSNLGYYTNFMNLLDCSAVAIPTGKYANAVGFGVTLFHSAFNDKVLLTLAKRVEDALVIAPGKTLYAHHKTKPSNQSPSTTIDVLVCGAHLEGLPLNWQLVERGAKKIWEGVTSKSYRLFALSGGPVKRPAMVRDEAKGSSIAVEVWRMPTENFGSFVAEIPSPLGIGKVELEDARWVSGFICDAWGLEGATDVTEFGAWRKYLESLSG